MIENYKFGHAWVNTNVPVYLGKAQPYIEVAQEKTGEAFMKLKSVSQSALDKLEEAAPGAQKHINNLGDNIVRVSQLAVAKIKFAGLQTQAFAIDAMK